MTINIQEAKAAMVAIADEISGYQHAIKESEVRSTQRTFSKVSYGFDKTISGLHTLIDGLEKLEADQDEELE